MARKPKPTAQKILEGNPGKRALNTREPKISSTGTLHKPPSHIKGVARKMWVYLVKTLPRGVLTGADVVQLELYCTAYAAYHEACQEIEKNGPVMVSGDKGFPMQSPWVAIKNKQVDIMVKTGSTLGLDPSARSKIQVQDLDDDNPFDEF